ncbi:B3 domain-containing protein [Platanthera guangdongensis]|uniref:B3 domain-containing protein n=1 Tax=Platanthera guangdongensis TaxID=2320717 RepID=A0ABR2N4L9_9ASPA
MGCYHRSKPSGSAVWASADQADLQTRYLGDRRSLTFPVTEANEAESRRPVTEATPKRRLCELAESRCRTLRVLARTRTTTPNDWNEVEELPNKLISQIGKLKNERKVVLLQDLSMKCWPVLYHQSINFIGFIGGWVDFARANNICRGDICEFELLSKTELKFLVQIRKEEESMFDDVI